MYPPVATSVGSGESDDPGRARTVLRTVTPGFRGQRNVGMDVVGWGVPSRVARLVDAAAPVTVLVWTVSKLFEALDAIRGG